MARTAASIDQQIPESFESLLANLQAESDRGCVLIAAAYLDDTLEMLLRTYFANDAASVRKAVDPLFSGLGPLSSLSAKTKLAFALKLIDPHQFHNLEMVRKIRNRFAHSFEGAALSSQELADQISSLILTDSAEERMKVRPETVQEAKLRFTIAVSYLIGFLQECTVAVGENAI